MQPHMTSNQDMRFLGKPFFDSSAMLKPLTVHHDGHVRTRFAPSPNGFLHSGHALSGALNRDFAMRYDGEFLLRIEDIDAQRSRPEYVDMIIEDMRWLYLKWHGDIIYQSNRLASYEQAFDRLKAVGLLYPCFCTRADIKAAIGERAVRHGPDGPHYPGTCRHIEHSDERCAHEPHAWRLDMSKALEYISDDLPLTWFDCEHGRQTADPSLFGDVVIWRKDAPASYHLAATCDDAADNITHVIRGMDLFQYTSVHRLLQNLLGLAEPIYWHHILLLDGDGEKLSKSRDSQSLFSLRKAGIAPMQVITLPK